MIMKNFDILLSDIKKIARQNGIRVQLTPYKRVKIYGGFCSGYFDEEKIIVATKRKKVEWVPVLIHESCHMDQLLEGCPFYKKSEKALYNFDAWTAGEISLTTKKQIDMIKLIQDMERDCEKRTIRKIKKYNLDIDTDYHAKLANIYLYSYEFMRHHKKWFSFTPFQKQLAPYVKDKIQNSHKRVPKDLYQKFEEYANIDSNKKAAR